MNNYENQSIARCFRILEVLNSSRVPLALSDISEASELHKATTFRLLGVLTQMGYVAKDHEQLVYTVGCRLHSFGWRSSVVSQIARVAQPLLQELAGTVGLTTYLSTREGRDTVSWAIARSGERCLAVTKGAHRDAHTAAEGKVLLAQCSPDVVRQIYADEVLRRHTKRSIGTIDGLMQCLKTTRSQGFGVNDQESELGVRSVAVPLYGYAKRAKFAVTVIGRTEHLPESAVPRMVERLQACASKIAKFLAVPNVVTLRDGLDLATVQASEARKDYAAPEMVNPMLRRSPVAKRGRAIPS